MTPLINPDHTGSSPPSGNPPETSDRCSELLKKPRSEFPKILYQQKGATISLVSEGIVEKEGLDWKNRKPSR